MASLGANGEAGAGGDAAHAERIAFERLLADLSARCANAAHDEILGVIEASLEQLVAFLGYDRCSYAEFAADGTLHVLCTATAEGVEPIARGRFGADLPWFVGELRSGRSIKLSRLPDELPPEAAAEAALVVRLGVRSHFSTPLRVAGRVVGVLAFASVRAQRTWPDEITTRLGIIGDVFASALTRARSDEEAQQLRNRLWHADRVARTSALTAAVAHELNQPLTAILSNAQAGLAYLAQGRPRADELRAILEAVVRDDKRAAETIRSMRALLRHDESGRARIDLAAALREILQLLAAELRHQGIRVETELEPGCLVMADKTQIEQVALNLILNAAAAMHARPRDERVLRVRVSRTGDGRVAAEVRDSGEGIPPEHLEAVFEPFWTTRREGLGLGLAICRSIVRTHGGAISVAPNPDRGVTFRFELERNTSEEDSIVSPASGGTARGETPVPAGSGEPVVCIVDDDAAVRESLVRLLTAAKWKVASFASANEFLERSPLADVGCLLLDNRMPGMSGLELQAHLASGGFTPPVVFLTGHGDLATGVGAMKLGAVDFLVKPVEQEILVAVVRKALERHADGRKQMLEREACRARVGRLSAREREVLEHVIRGRLNKQIAADLDIAEQTVKQHRGRVMEKMAVRSVPELMRVCEVSGLFDAEGHAAAGSPAP